MLKPIVNTWFPLAGGVAPPKLPGDGFIQTIFVSMTDELVPPEPSTYSPTTKMGVLYDPTLAVDDQFLPVEESHAPI
jgi:hypothetical protein